MSLRTFHLGFIFLCMVGADLFAVWSVVYWLRHADPVILALGMISALGGVGLMFYGIRLVRKLDEANIH